MKGIKRIGVMALATAMSITCVAPISANAQTYDSSEEVYDIDRTGTSTIDENDNVKENVTSTVYKNRITGDTYDTANTDSDAKYKATHYYKEEKKITIGTDEYILFSPEHTTGESVSSVKIKSGKDVISLKKAGYYEKTVEPSYDKKTKEVYFERPDHTREVIATSEKTPSDEQNKAWRRVMSDVAYRIGAKKPGTAKITYKVGSKKHTLTVTVSNDARVFTNVTFAGKKLIYDKDRSGNNANNWESNTTNKSGIDYVTKKSGKFKVTMGKNYKFVKAYVIKSTPFTTKTDSNSMYSYSWAKRQTTTGVDLNGDGDTLDTVYGLKENNYKANTVQVIKNNKKIKLDTTADKYEYNYSYNDGKYAKLSLKDNKAATTRVIVVYQNKITKTYGTEEFDLVYRTSKK